MTSLLKYHVSFSCERQWRDIAFCLSRMSYSERGIRKIQDNFPCFADKLGEEEVYSNFVSLLTGAKSFAKPEVKVLNFLLYIITGETSRWIINNLQTAVVLLLMAF